MRCNLVEQQDRSTTLPFGNEICVRQNNTNQQRLLLSRRARGCRDALVEMGDDHVLTMRSIKRAPCRCIAVAPLGKIVGEVTRRIETVKSQRCAGKGARRFTGKSAPKASNDFCTPGSNGKAVRNHCRFKRR